MSGGNTPLGLKEIMGPIGMPTPRIILPVSGPVVPGELDKMLAPVVKDIAYNIPVPALEQGSVPDEGA